MIIETTCKYCKKPLRLEIPDDMKGIFSQIVPLACCDRCASLKERQRAITHALEASCNRLIANPNPKEDWLAKEREILTSVTKAYVRMVGDWYNMRDLPWEEGLVDALLKSPRSVSTVVGAIWETAKQNQLPI